MVSPLRWVIDRTHRITGGPDRTRVVVLFLAGLGAVAGVLISGRIADRMLRRGRLDARIVVGAGQAAAPLLFGIAADALGGARVSTNAQGPVSANTGQALAQTFGLMLVPLLASGLVLLVARHHYPRDVATAAASERSQASREHNRERERSRAPARLSARR